MGWVPSYCKLKLQRPRVRTYHEIRSQSVASRYLLLVDGNSCLRIVHCCRSQLGEFDTIRIKRASIALVGELFVSSAYHAEKVSFLCMVRLNMHSTGRVRLP